MCNRGNGFFISGQELTMSREWSLALSGRFFPMQPLFQQSGTFRRNRCNRLSIAVLIGLLMKNRLGGWRQQKLPNCMVYVKYIHICRMKIKVALDLYRKETCGDGDSVRNSKPWIPSGLYSKSGDIDGCAIPISGCCKHLGRRLVWGTIRQSIFVREKSHQITFIYLLLSIEEKSPGSKNMLFSCLTAFRASIRRILGSHYRHSESCMFNRPV